MEEMIQKRDELLTKIDAIVDKLEQVQDDVSLTSRRQIVLILENLKGSLLNCDSKLLLKPTLEGVSSNLNNTE